MSEINDRNDQVRQMIEGKQPKINVPSVINIDPKDPLKCPSCGEVFTQFSGVTPGHSNQVRKGGIFMCAHCGAPSIVGDSNLEPLTQPRFDALPEHVKAALKSVSTVLSDTSTTNVN